MANLSFLDIIKMNNGDGITGLVEESVAAAPELVVGSSRTIAGQQYNTLVRNSIPTVGFRSANEGATAVASGYENKLVQTFILDAPIETDKAVADAHEDGWEAVMAIEGAGVLEGAFRALGSQMYYGTATTVATSAAGSPTKGFPGLIETVDAANVYDVTGTGSDTSSAWLVKWGPRDCQWVIGMDGAISTGDVRVERLTDGSSNPYDGYRLPLLAYVGLQVVNANSVARIKNIDSAGNMMSDDALFEGLALFPAGSAPDSIFMSTRSLNQLRASRTATNATGAPAPIPTEVAGIPIHATDAISDTEVAG